MSRSVQLKHGEIPISAELKDVKCEWVENTIKSLDESMSEKLTGVTLKEEKISLKDLVQKIEVSCPDLKGKIQISNPEKVVTFQSDNMYCSNIEPVLQTLDKNSDAKTIRQTEIKDIKLSSGQNDDYAQAITFKFPKDAVEKNYSAECTAVFSVDTKGKAFDILPICINGTAEAQEFFEKYMRIAIENTQFPVKTENGKNLIVKNKEVKAKWRFWNPEHPIIEREYQSK